MSAGDTLADRQRAFLASILDEDAALPAGWGNSQAAGMAVYRGNYRGALMDSLAETFARTRAYVGAKSFAQASINHIIQHPPTHWTLDKAGEGFPAVCDAFFDDASGVGELAWIEWAMAGLVTAPDEAPVSAQDFAAASADFGQDQWAGLRLTFQSRMAVREVAHNWAAIWADLAQAEEGAPVPRAARLDRSQSCMLWREGERPTFTLDAADHVAAIRAMQGGAAYGDMIAVLIGDAPELSDTVIQSAAMRAGAMLGQWLNMGIITGFDA